MPRNMGNADRTLRVIAALVLAVLAYTGTVTGTLALVAWIVAAVFVATSVVSFCPLYRLVGMNTCGKG